MRLRVAQFAFSFAIALCARAAEHPLLKLERGDDRMKVCMPNEQPGIGGLYGCEVIDTHAHFYRVTGTGVSTKTRQGFNNVTEIYFEVAPTETRFFFWFVPTEGRRQERIKNATGADRDRLRAARLVESVAVAQQESEAEMKRSTAVVYDVAGVESVATASVGALKTNIDKAFGEVMKANIIQTLEEQIKKEILQQLSPGLKEDLIRELTAYIDQRLAERKPGR